MVQPAPRGISHRFAPEGGRDKKSKNKKKTKTEETPLWRRTLGQSPEGRTRQGMPHAQEGLPRRTDLKRSVVPGRTRPRRRRSVGPKPRRTPTPKPVIPSCPRCAPEARKSQANHAGRTESDPGPCPCSPLGPVLALDVLRAHRAERTSLRMGTTSHASPTRRIQNIAHAFPTLAATCMHPSPCTQYTIHTCMSGRGRGSPGVWPNLVNVVVERASVDDGYVRH